MRILVAMVLLFVPLAALASGDELTVTPTEHDVKSIIMHTVNLFILLGVLGYLLRGKIKDAVANRSAQIKKSIDDAAALRKETQLRFDDVERKLSGFEKQLSEMRADAESEAEKEHAAILQRAERDAKTISEAAERTIRDETARARQSLRAEAAALSVSLAEKQLSKDFNPEDQRRFADEFLGAVKKTNGVGHG